MAFSTQPSAVNTCEIMLYERASNLPLAFLLHSKLLSMNPLHLHAILSIRIEVGLKIQRPIHLKILIAPKFPTTTILNQNLNISRADLT